MRISKFLFLVVGLLLLTACAQVVSINGGPVDKVPPRVVENGITPPNASTNFKSKEIRFKFDEFVKLNNPTQTITVVPDNIKIDATIEKKTVVLKIVGEPQENTTYVITMNGAVKDFTESNDSLMQFVFSTGPVLDSLTFKGIVLDAKEMTPTKNTFVGLYLNRDSAVYNKPLYYASTNDKGEFKFEYLRPGVYEIYAIDDQSKDSKWQKTEKIAFSETLVDITPTSKDSLQLLLFQPELPSKLSVKYVFPSRYSIASKKPIDLKAITFEGQQLPDDLITWHTTDSLSFIARPVENSASIVVQYEDKSDSLRVKMPNNKRKILKPSIDIQNNLKGFFETDSMVIRFSDRILAVDTSKIHLLQNDTVKIPFDFNFKNDVLKISWKGVKSKNIRLNVLDQALKFENFSESFSFTRTYDIIDISAFGSLHLSFNQLTNNAVVEMIFEGNIFKTFNVAKDGKQVFIPNLSPGNYSFKAFVDENDDGRWTTGDFELKRKPEPVIRFTEGVKIRSNWEIEAELVPISNE